MLVEASLKSVLTRDVTQAQWDALALFVNNIGVHAFARSTLLRKLNGGDAIGARLELRKWVHVDGSPSTGLLKRRLAESVIWSGGADIIDAPFLNVLLQYLR